jgi:hypothetical protein
VIWLCEQARRKRNQKAFDDTKLANDIRTPEQKKEAEAARAEKDKKDAAKGGIKGKGPAEENGVDGEEVGFACLFL